MGRATRAIPFIPLLLFSRSQFRLLSLATLLIDVGQQMLLRGQEPRELAGGDQKPFGRISDPITAGFQKIKNLSRDERQVGIAEAYAKSARRVDAGSNRLARLIAFNIERPSDMKRDVHSQPLQGPGFVLVLGAAFFSDGLGAARPVAQTHRRVGFVPLLAAGAAGAVGVHLTFVEQLLIRKA